ncbi:MAG: hypothetical protein QXI33_00400 [Candidatus Pacearchaeota archaeon]
MKINKLWLKYGIFSLIIGVILLIVLLLIAHFCQIITGNNPYCKNFIFPLHLFVELSKIPSEKIAFGIGIVIILLFFMFIGIVIGLKKGDLNSQRA